MGRITAKANGFLMGKLIEKKWNLENWNDKNPTYRTKIKGGET